jgi:hypothetical protein
MGQASNPASPSARGSNPGMPSSQATDATLGSLADDARNAASAVADQAREKAADLGSAMSDAASSFAEQQKEVGSRLLDTMSRAAGAAADELGKGSPEIAKQIRSVASSLDALSSDIRQHSVGDLTGRFTEMARRQPAAVMAGTAVAGFMLARLIKSSATSQATMGAGAQRYRSDFGSGSTGRMASGSSGANRSGQFQQSGGRPGDDIDSTQTGDKIDRWQSGDQMGRLTTDGAEEPDNGLGVLGAKPASVKPAGGKPLGGKP